MPKRPSAITVTPDAHILTADKFGDVYSLPLLGTIHTSASGTPRSSTPTATAAVAAAPAAAVALGREPRALPSRLV